MNAVQSTLQEFLSVVVSQKQNRFFGTPMFFGNVQYDDFNIPVEEVARKATEGNAIVVLTNGALLHGFNEVVCYTALLYAFYKHFSKTDKYHAAKGMIVPCLFKHYDAVSLIPVEKYEKPPIEGEAFLAYAKSAMDMLQRIDTKELEYLFLKCLKQDVLVLSGVPTNINIKIDRIIPDWR
jgi:hypothetical protein